jgi:hypothetical protein
MGVVLIHKPENSENVHPTLNMTLELRLFHPPVPPPPPPPPPSAIFPFRPRSITIVYPFYPLLLRSYVWLSDFAPTFTFLFDSFMSMMGRRRTVEDYQRTAAENCWVPGAHEEDSKRQTKDELSDRYKQSQQEVLNQWIMWVPDSALNHSTLALDADGVRLLSGIFVPVRFRISIIAGETLTDVR